MLSLKNITIPATREYITGSNLEPLNFYIDALCFGKQIDLLLGYFSSSAIQVLSLGFAKFIASGGTMRLIINQFLKKEDKQAIIQGIEKPPEHFFENQIDVLRIKENLDAYGEHFFNCLAWLISNKKIRIQVIKPKQKIGISHYKSGLVSDGENKIRFKGSCNFTAQALLENLEELEVKCSWHNEEDILGIKQYEDYFDEIFAREADFVEYISVYDIEEVILNDFKIKPLEELIDDEKQLLEISKSRKIKSNSHLQKQFQFLEKELREVNDRPRFPFPSGARDYQNEAYRNWKTNNFKGVFAMATGTGKTITALNCLLEEYQRNGKYRSVILVPTNVLVQQWYDETQKFNYGDVYRVSSKYKWREILSGLLGLLTFNDSKSFIIITTYASFYRDKFQSYFRRLPKDTVLIADEAHNIASPKVKAILPHVKLQKRLALSATPKRAYDEEGNEAIETFFSSKPPYTYNFSMERAINEGVLTKYTYYPHIVFLTPEELVKYVKLSKQLLNHFDPKTRKFKDNSAVQILLMKRKRIIHKAHNKAQKFTEIIKNKYSKKHHLKYTFVYVPEGFSENENLEQTDQEEIRIINQYVDIIKEVHSRAMVFPFLGETKNKQEILEIFSKGKIEVLASMKCLDEGVDVPRTELAIFCSSTGNPRQFIQRRGRILRKHNDKHLAEIHDLVVFPDYRQMHLNKASFNFEKNLVKKELERVIHFASMAINNYEAFEVFNDICEYYGLNIYSLKETLSL